MASMYSSTAWIRKHIQDIIFRLGTVTVFRLKCLMLLPELLPFLLNFVEVIKAFPRIHLFSKLLINIGNNISLKDKLNIQKNPLNFFCQIYYQKTRSAVTVCLWT